MCGIAAWFGTNGRARSLELGLISHRGPDSHGVWTAPDESAWLGHTRLAIRDLSPQGAQPMTDPVSGNVIVFNGEIYNDPDLRRELAPHGIQWRGTSDTETLLHGYRIWGDGLLRRAKGMFAFLIFDRAKGTLFGARDRLGIKPLYLARTKDGLLLASEVRILLREIGRKVSPSGVAGYLRWGANPEASLLFEGIESLPPAHLFTVAKDGSISSRKYWTPGTTSIASSADPLETIRGLLEKSVEEHLLSDVPVASFLSGGIDSSVITALAARKHGSPIRTFSVGFGHAKYDETGIADEVAKRYGTEHCRIELSDAEIMASVTESVAHMDLPSVDAINTYIVSKAVRQRGVKVALSGLGGDELFGGYPSVKDVPKLVAFARLPAFARSLISRFSKNRERLSEIPGTDAGSVALWRRAFWTEAQLRDAGLPVPQRPVASETGLSDAYAQTSWAELSGYMRHMLLRDSDQMSMAVALELRVPFLDHDLVDYALSLPAAIKEAGDGVKPLLVKSTADLLPRSVYDRPKQGFVLPMSEWMRGPLAGFVTEGLASLRATGLIAARSIAASEESFNAGRLHWTRLWALVVLGHYLGRR